MSHSQEDGAISPLKLAVALVSVALAVAFHIFAVHQFRGIGLALFGITAVILIEILVSRAKIVRNRWAYGFLAPFAGFVAAVALYASEPVQFFASAFALVSFVCYGYWLTAPSVRWSEAPLFWSKPFAVEGVLPIARTKTSFFDRLRSSQHGSSILFGVVIALPVLVILSLLFASADPVFAKIVERLIPATSDQAMLLYGRLFLDLVVLVYALRYGWLLVTRQAEDRRPVEPLPMIHVQINLVTFATVFILVNALFALFLLVQLGSMFGDVSWMLEQGMTYAERARQGFFQLIFVGGLTGLLLLLTYRFTGIRERLARGLSYALIAQVLLVLISAARRLALYIDAYNWTVDRAIAAVIIVFISVGYIWFLTALLQRFSFTRLVNVGVVGTMAFFSLVLLVNWDGFVAKRNVDAFLSGEARTIDLRYLNGLSIDAQTPLLRLANEPWPVMSERARSERDDKVYIFTSIHDDLERATTIKTEYLLGLTITEWFADSR